MTENSTPLDPLALIIEDDTRLAKIFAEAIKSVKFRIEVINDGQVAVDRLKEIVPAIIILDLHLPRISGQDILQQIRADSRLKNTRVMLATADSLLADSLREQADLVLLKPISFGQLRDLAARLRPPDTMLD